MKWEGGLNPSYEEKGLAALSALPTGALGVRAHFVKIARTGNYNICNII